MRTPATIAAAARDHLDTANKAFVPVNVVKSAELAVEFMESTAAALAAAGIAPPEPEGEGDQPAQG